LHPGELGRGGREPAAGGHAAVGLETLFGVHASGRRQQADSNRRIVGLHTKIRDTFPRLPIHPAQLEPGGGLLLAIHETLQPSVAFNAR
jgi:hypothetical protein